MGVYICDGCLDCVSPLLLCQGVFVLYLKPRGLQCRRNCENTRWISLLVCGGSVEKPSSPQEGHCSVWPSDFPAFSNQSCRINFWTPLWVSFLDTFLECPSSRSSLMSELPALPAPGQRTCLPLVPALPSTLCSGEVMWNLFLFCNPVWTGRIQLQEPPLPPWTAPA